MYCCTHSYIVIFKEMDELNKQEDLQLFYFLISFPNCQLQPIISFPTSDVNMSFIHNKGVTMRAIFSNPAG